MKELALYELRIGSLNNRSPNISTCSPFFSWMCTNDLKDCCARASVYVPCKENKRILSKGGDKCSLPSFSQIIDLAVEED